MNTDYHELTTNLYRFTMAIYKTKDEINKRLSEQLTKAAKDYALELHRMWELEVTGDDYWIGGDEHPCSAPYQLHSCYFLSLDTMQYIVENDITMEEYEKYDDYRQEVHTISSDLHVPDFQEWRKHPDLRYPEEMLERMRTMRCQLDDEIENARKRYGKEGWTRHRSV